MQKAWSQKFANVLNVDIVIGEAVARTLNNVKHGLNEADYTKYWSGFAEYAERRVYEELALDPQKVNMASYHDVTQTRKNHLMNTVLPAVGKKGDEIGRIMQEIDADIEDAIKEARRQHERITTQQQGVSVSR